MKIATAITTTERVINAITLNYHIIEIIIWISSVGCLKDILLLFPKVQMCILKIIHLNEFACKSATIQCPKNTHEKSSHWRQTVLYQGYMISLPFLFTLQKTPKCYRLGNKRSLFQHFGLDDSWLWGRPGTVGCSVASSTMTHRMPEVNVLQPCDQKCLPTWPNVPGDKTAPI